MSRWDKFRARLMDPAREQNIEFEKLSAYLEILGFSPRQGSGSHIIFFHPNVEEIINLQPRQDGTAKPYQVRQVREIIIKYGF